MRFPPRLLLLFSSLFILSLFLASFFIVHFFPEDPSWQRIQQRKTITFATDATFPPFASLDEKGNFLASILAGQRVGKTARSQSGVWGGVVRWLAWNVDRESR